jgi:hypothetical protein
MNEENSWYRVEDDRPGGNIWLCFHFLSLILAVGKLYDGFQTLPWWFIFIPFEVDLVVIVFVSITLVTLCVTSFIFRH